MVGVRRWRLQSQLRISAKRVREATLTREAAVIDAWQEGLDIDRIARDADLPKWDVEQIIIGYRHRKGQ